MSVQPSGQCFPFAVSGPFSTLHLLRSNLPMWPLDDTRVIHTHCAHQVLAQRDPIEFRDWRVLHLHPVAHNGHRTRWLRALRVDGLQWCVFNLRRLAHTIEGIVIRPRCTPRSALLSRLLDERAA